MTRYIGLLDGSDGAFGIVIPDLPGCTSGGATADEAVVNAVEAVSLWVADAREKGDEVPRARRLGEIMMNHALMSEAREDGAVMVSIPLIEDRGEPVRYNWSTDTGLLTAIREDARRRKITASAWLASAAREKLSRIA